MDGLTVQMTLTAEQMAELAQMVAAALPPRPVDRQTAMVERWGEACTKKQAMDALNVSAPTLWRMLEDGRIRATADGLRVDVRSVADYIDNRADEDRAARIRGKQKKGR